MIRRPQSLVVLAIAAGGAFLCLSAAQDPKPDTSQTAVPVILTPPDLKWVDAPPVFPKGAKFAAMAGDHAKAEAFVMRAKFPANYKVPPHFHSATEFVTIVSGELNIAAGDVFDATKAKALPAGSFVTMPAKAHHFAFNKDETVIQIHGTGPFDLVYVNPADDPRNKSDSKGEK